MKNKIKLVDVSILSTYMGRWLTGFVTLFVVGITISALLSSGNTEHSIVGMCVGSPFLGSKTPEFFDPLRVLLARETRRPVVLSFSGEPCRSGHDLYVLPIEHYLDYADELELVPLYEVRPRFYQDRVVLFARASEGSIDISALAPRDVVFSDPSSINGFLLPLSILFDRGFEAPAGVDAFRFEGAETDRSRVIFSVLFGDYRIGACRLTDLTELIEAGVIRQGELKVIGGRETFPDWIIATRREDESYYRGKLRSISRTLRSDVATTNQGEQVRLLKSYGIGDLEPVDTLAIQAASTLRRRFDRVFDANEGVRP